MNVLKRAIIEKAGYQSGFEYQASSTHSGLELASSRHPAKATITEQGADYRVAFTSSHTESLLSEVQRAYPNFIRDNDFIAGNEAELVLLLKTASKLAYVLPNNVLSTYEEEVGAEIDRLPHNERGTEVERLIKQRVGQSNYRKALLEYWGGKCAVTGVSLTDVLRASHAKPWSECVNDSQRLDVFNGFLLTANLDALFDRFLITFDRDGVVKCSTKLTEDNKAMLGINLLLKLRWITENHQYYLEYHRSEFLRLQGV